MSFQDFWAFPTSSAVQQSLPLGAAGGSLGYHPPLQSLIPLLLPEEPPATPSITLLTTEADPATALQEAEDVMVGLGVRPRWLPHLRLRLLVGELPEADVTFAEEEDLPKATLLGVGALAQSKAVKAMTAREVSRTLHRAAAEKWQAGALELVGLSGAAIANQTVKGGGLGRSEGEEGAAAVAMNKARKARKPAGAAAAPVQVEKAEEKPGRAGAQTEEGSPAGDGGGKDRDGDRAGGAVAEQVAV